MLVAQVRHRFAHLRWSWEAVRVLRRAGLIRLAHPLAAHRQARDVGRWGVVGAVRLAAGRQPGAVGLIDDRGALTFGELERRSNALAWAWRGQGIRQDSAIGVLCRNHRGPVEALLAAAKLGAQVVPLPTDLAGASLAAVVQREGITALVYDHEFRPGLGVLPERVRRYLAWTDGDERYDVVLDELIAAAPAHEPPLPAEPGGLTFLAGDRGVPCRVAPVHFAAQFLHRIPLPRGQAVLVGTPLHCPHALAPLLVALAAGSAVVLQRDADPQRLLGKLVRYRCATVVVTPQRLRDLLTVFAPGVVPGDLSVQVLLSSGGRLAADVGNRATELLGPVLHNWYCSEVSLLAAVATPADWQAAPGTVGHAPFGCRIAIVADDGRRIERPGRPGHVHVGNLFADGPLPGSDGELLPSGAIGYVDRDGRLFLDGQLRPTGTQPASPERRRNSR